MSHVSKDIDAGGFIVYEKSKYRAKPIPTSRTGTTVSAPYQENDKEADDDGDDGVDLGRAERAEGEDDDVEDAEKAKDGAYPNVCLILRT